MIKFAVMTFMYNNWADSDAGSHPKLLEIIAEAGADGIEAFCNPFMGNDELVGLYKRSLADNKLAMPVMDLMANLACGDRLQRQQEYDKMRMGIDICEGFGCEIVHVAGCMLADGQNPSDARKLIAEGLADFAGDIEGRGMTLAFEDFDPAPTLICSLEDCLEIMALAGENVKFVFDTGNFEAAGQHAEDNYAKIADKICHFHFKDFRPDNNPRGLAGTDFGQGIIKNAQIARLAVESGYEGWAALESYPQRGNGPAETVAAELKILKSMFQGN